MRVEKELTAKASDDIIKLEKFNFACEKAKSSGKLNKRTVKKRPSLRWSFFYWKN